MQGAICAAFVPGHRLDPVVTAQTRGGGAGENGRPGGLQGWWWC